MKVFIGFSEVSGFAARLGSLLGRAGHEVVCINSTPSDLDPDRGEQSGFRELARGWFRFSNKLKERLRLVHGMAQPLIFLGRLAIYLSALRRSEVMIFLGCGRLLPGNLDRRLAKWCGRRTINVYLGSASRPVILGGSGVRMAEQSDRQLRKLAKRLRRQRKRVRAIAGICDEIVENPLCSHFQPRCCVDWFRLGFPSGGEIFPADAGVAGTRSDGRVVVLHCPSKPRIKGTERIRAVMAALGAEEMPVEYVEITGRPHREVLKRLAECDFVIDQLYSDSPLAGFASEASWFAKPAVVGGYGWDILRALPSGEWMAPSAICHPDELEETVRGLVEDAGRREELGAQAKEYCDGFLGGPAFLDRFGQLMRGEVPAEWRFDPRDVCYLHGLGQEEEDLRTGLRRYLERFGKRGLCFDEREDLVKAVEEFVAE